MPSIGVTSTVGFDAQQLARVRGPLLHADRLVAGPVDDRGRRGGGGEQRADLLVDVVFVDRAVQHGSQRVEIRRPAAIASAWSAGRPPFGPYEAFMRAIVTGRSKAREQKRATAS